MIKKKEINKIIINDIKRVGAEGQKFWSRKLGDDGECCGANEARTEDRITFEGKCRKLIRNYKKNFAKREIKN